MVSIGRNVNIRDKVKLTCNVRFGIAAVAFSWFTADVDTEINIIAVGVKFKCFRDCRLDSVAIIDAKRYCDIIFGRLMVTPKVGVIAAIAVEIFKQKICRLVCVGSD